MQGCAEGDEERSTIGREMQCSGREMQCNDDGVCREMRCKGDQSRMDLHKGTTSSLREPE